MNSTDEEAEQEREWSILYDKIVEMLSRFGTEDYLGRADYLIVDDNYGFRRHKIEIHKLKMLRPELISSLHGLLPDFPNWEIVVAVDVPGTERTWPRMGITIRKHEIIDGLVRQYLPPEIAAFRYPGSRPGTGYD